jgi:hypothetical protein
LALAVPVFPRDMAPTNANTDNAIIPLFKFLLFIIFNSFERSFYPKLCASK